MKKDYFKCECGSENFTELTLEYAEQSGVRININGQRDYEEGSEIELVGETQKIISYKCDDCESKYVFREGHMCSASEEGAPEEDPLY